MGVKGSQDLGRMIIEALCLFFDFVSFGVDAKLAYQAPAVSQVA